VAEYRAGSPPGLSMPASRDCESLRRAIEEISTSFRGTLGVAAHDLLTDSAVTHNADTLFPTASVIKLPVLLELASQVGDGRYAWTDRIVLDPANRVTGSGILQDLDDGIALTVRDWAVLMIVLSDNTATNQCIDLVDVRNVNASLRRWGCEGTTLYRKVCEAPGPQQPYFGTGTPADFARLLLGLARGALLAEGPTGAVLDILRRQQHTDLLGRFLPFDGDLAREEPDRHLTLYSKSGWVYDIRNDVAIVRGNDVAYVVAVFSKDSGDESPSVDNAGALVVARLSQAIWQSFGGRYRPPQ
jgi:beta-lactamase class A